MRLAVTAASLFLVAGTALPAQTSEEFSGTWKLNRSRSDARNLPADPDAVLTVENKGTSLHIVARSETGAPATTYTYPLDGTEARRNSGAASLSTRTKWEGSALIVNTLVSGSQNYTVMERWKQSRDGSTLTITRVIVRMGHEAESVLVYENPDRAAVANAARTTLASRPTPAAPQQTSYTVEAGTRILLALISPLNTKGTAPGDRVYLETKVPVLSGGRVVIPPGSQVTATVTDAVRPGRVKGKASLYLRFDSLILPNGTVRDFRSRPGSVEGATLDRAEGKIEGEGSKGKDAGTVAKTTSTGAGVGTMAGAASGHYGMGTAIGAAAGAAAGLAGILGSRGSDLMLPKGTTMEMILDRDLRYEEAELTPSVR